MHATETTQMEARTTVETQETDMARLQVKHAKKSESLWAMKKADLVEVAMKELGWTRAMAEW